VVFSGYSCLLHQNITEILLKVALKTINQTNPNVRYELIYISMTYFISFQVFSEVVDNIRTVVSLTRESTFIDLYNGHVDIVYM
jgi:hypothetical protein